MVWSRFFNNTNNSEDKAPLNPGVKPSDEVPLNPMGKSRSELQSKLRSERLFSHLPKPPDNFAQAKQAYSDMSKKSNTPIDTSRYAANAEQQNPLVTNISLSK